MANIIKVRRSATPSAVPTTSALALGELAINTNDGKLFLKKSVAGVETIVDVTASGGGVATFSAGTTGFTPTVATSGAVVLAGTLAIANGGTGNATGTATINANSTGAITSVGNATSLGSFTSAQLAGALTDETGTGAAVFATNPTLSGVTLAGAVAGGGNQLNNVIIGASSALAGSFSTLNTTGNVVGGSIIASNPANTTVPIRWTRPNKTYTTYLDVNNNGGTDWTLWDDTRSTPVLSVNGTTGGLAVTGTLSATGGIPASNVTGTLPVANGGTGNATGTASGVSAGVVAGKMIYDAFTATASQTTFTSSTTYTSGKINVFVNGVKMVNGTDVTVTSGTSVVFGTGLAVGMSVNLVYPI